MLIKYSDRGLVSGGRVSPLFGQLYLTVTLATTIFSYLVVEARHFRPSNEPQPAMLKYLTLHVDINILNYVFNCSICKMKGFAFDKDHFKTIYFLEAMNFLIIFAQILLLISARNYIQSRKVSYFDTNTNDKSYYKIKKEHRYQM